MLHPELRMISEQMDRDCGNTDIQRGRPKRTLLGSSEVEGFGLFMGEPVKEGEFLGEYVGEIVSSAEAERRGVIYNLQKLSYLFTSNKAQDVDATQYGNKLRFINHSRAARNCQGKLLFVNGVQRIALYSTRAIEAGEELFFDYGPEFHATFLSKEPKRKGVRKPPDPKTTRRMVTSGTAKTDETNEADRARLARRRKRDEIRVSHAVWLKREDSISDILPSGVRRVPPTVQDDARYGEALPSSSLNGTEVGEVTMIDPPNQAEDDSSEWEFMNALPNAASAVDDEGDSDYGGSRSRRRRRRRRRRQTGSGRRIPRTRPRDISGRFLRSGPAWGR
ncbi:MAG: hypothetical protein M1823_000158 [Watsoniomyces obsoletus]|nr:MAG: hypothetical protein M1823_000158 [Watsoniomyces obsoletus]